MRLGIAIPCWSRGRLLRRGLAAVLCLAVLLSSFAHASGFHGNGAGSPLAAVSHESDAGCGSATDHEADGACPSDVGCPLLALIPPLILPALSPALAITNVDAPGIDDHGTSPSPRPPKLSI